MRCLNVAVFAFALLLRALVGFHPHSGQDDYQGGAAAAAAGGAAPAVPATKYGGDYEAQRHWMELTYHLPLSEWYRHDLDYWGLDYPPLTAYVSWACGWAAHRAGSLHAGAAPDADAAACRPEDDAVCADDGRRSARSVPDGGLRVLRDLVALHSSRWGFEAPGGKLYMRGTVLLFDALVYMSAVWALAGRLTRDDGGGEEGAGGVAADASLLPAARRRRLCLVLTALCQPALVLIDHGHFQYNAVSLGLALWSFHFMTSGGAGRRRSFAGPAWGSVLFCLALNFKQMELYHAPAVFAYLLGR